MPPGLGSTPPNDATAAGGNGASGSTTIGTGGAGSGLPCGTPVGAFVYSHSPDFAVMIPLEGATLSSPVYVRFLACDPKMWLTFESNKAQVNSGFAAEHDVFDDWDAPGPIRPEFFGAGEINLTATPSRLDQRSLGSSTAQFRTSQGVLTPGLYRTDASRTVLQPLEGAVLADDAHVVLLPSLLLAAVVFEFTDSAAPLLRAWDGHPPLDFTSGYSPRIPLRTTDHPNGQYTINAVEYNSLAEVNHTAQFTIQN